MFAISGSIPDLIILLQSLHGEFDSKVLSACKQFREKYKDIKIQVAITSFQKIKKQVIKDEIFGDEIYVPYDDVETIMFDIEEEHFKKQITVSNRQMIDLCDTLICFVDKTRNPSGAKTAMNYAKRKGLKIVNLYREEDEPTYGMTKEEKKKYYENWYNELKERVNKKKNDLQ